MSRLIYQYFGGRGEGASVKRDKGKVFAKLANYSWENLVKAGVDTVYLLGIFDNRGKIRVMEEEGMVLEDENRLPSVFALTDHRNTNPDLGTVTELIKLVEKIHDAGLKVWMDFIPNHTGLDHEWIKTHPEYYVYDESGNLVTEFSGDVAKLNYDSSELREETKKTLNFIAELGADGVRCDMAHLIPTDFWQEVVAEMSVNFPQFEWVAEAYSDSVFNWLPLERLVEAGFNYIYQEFWFRNLKLYLDKSISLSDLINFIKASISHTYKDRWLYYVLNHDDYLPDKCSRLLPVLTMLSKILGSSLIFNGQLNGQYRRLRHHVYDELPSEYSELFIRPNWWVDFREWYRSIEVLDINLFSENDLLGMDLKTASGTYKAVFSFTNSLRGYGAEPLIYHYSSYRKPNDEGDLVIFRVSD